MKNFLLTCSFLFLISISIFPQEPDVICPVVQVDKSAEYAQVGGIFKPSQNAPGEFLRVLIVFAEFEDDTNEYTTWDYGELPFYANSILDASPSSTYTPFTLSDYWKTMSMGNFDIIGDIYPEVIRINSEAYYRTNGKYFQDCNLEVLNRIDDGTIDFRQYDNWRFNSATGAFESNEGDGDRILDMMYIIYRNPINDNLWFTTTWYDDFTAIAILGDDMDYTTMDNIKIGGHYIGHNASGITVRQGASYSSYPDFMTKVLSHELGHYLFGSDHTTFGGIMGNNSAGHTGTLSGYERERLGYVSYTVAYQNNFTTVLGDYVTEGDVLQIPIPSTNDYFLVENHQRLNRYDQIARGGPIQGLLIQIPHMGKEFMYG
ncbi:MAG: hypothetical protein AUK34_12135 [Ignavibacteria bacterium CG2_30_36_16]|nr:hypothetical protein [Ignavibacteria bacterium]OIP55965.1 MAG: hypothetical protein AUK34_12135 [Ignavibacteria bacterium CG2_30_36_16]PJA99700.1 MAG: hypothetical protein CO127_09980 [Ignavibacteria bacterium CG_4_9_14_3_um_filter_36_18]